MDSDSLYRLTRKAVDFLKLELTILDQRLGQARRWTLLKLPAFQMTMQVPAVDRTSST
jgi:hypothetical protein